MAFNAKIREVYKPARNLWEVIICYFVTRDPARLFLKYNSAIVSYTVAPILPSEANHGQNVRGIPIHEACAYSSISKILYNHE